MKILGTFSSVPEKFPAAWTPLGRALQGGFWWHQAMQTALPGSLGALRLPDPVHSDGDE